MLISIGSNAHTNIGRSNDIKKNYKILRILPFASFSQIFVGFRCASSHRNITIEFEWKRRIYIIRIHTSIYCLYHCAYIIMGDFCVLSSNLNLNSDWKQWIGWRDHRFKWFINRPIVENNTFVIWNQDIEMALW